MTASLSGHNSNYTTLLTTIHSLIIMKAAGPIETAHTSEV